MSKKEDTGNWATLENIASYLNIPLGPSKSENRWLALLFLPDIIEVNLLDASMEATAWKAKEFQYLIRGNYSTQYQIEYGKAEPSCSYANRALTEYLLSAIKENKEIIYKDNLGKCCCRENMMEKINYLVSRTSSTKLTSLFTNLKILPFFEIEKSTQNDVEKAIELLIKQGNYAYALFILVLTSVFRGSISQLSDLYSSKEIQKTLLSKGYKSIFPDDCMYFNDPKYMRNYHVFLYRNLKDSDHLFEKGTLKLDNTDKIPTATLRLEDSEKESCLHLYEGFPMLTGNTVYIPMGDKENDNALGILCFDYENFSNNKPMYFRSGLLLSCNFRDKTPQVHKVAITLKKREDMKESDIDAIKGQLRTSGPNIVFTEEDLEDFINDSTIQKETWYQDFKKYIYPTILKKYDFNNCCITEEDIRNVPRVGALSSQDLIKISYILKQYAERIWRKKNTVINCVVPADFHYLVREDDSDEN